LGDRCQSLRHGAIAQLGLGSCGMGKHYGLIYASTNTGHEFVATPLVSCARQCQERLLEFRGDGADFRKSVRGGSAPQFVSERCGFATNKQVARLGSQLLNETSQL